MIRRDPVEQTERYKQIEEELDRKIKARIGEGGYLGYCHQYWEMKKLILLEEYGIEWQSPAELNRDVIFD